MNQQNITVKTVHTVNDQDITTLSNDELLNYVVTIEQNIEKLKAIKEASSYVVREIEKQTKVLKTIVAHLDNRK